MNQDFLSEYLPYIFLATGLIALAIASFWDSPKAKLKQTGVPVEGIIFEQSYKNSFDRSSDFSRHITKDKITVRFVTTTGDWITGMIKQDFGMFYPGQYKDGETVKVFYDKDNPSDFYVDTKQSPVLGRVILALVGLIFLIIGLYKIFV